MNNNNSNTSYFIGFVLSLILTIIPFYTIQYNIFDKKILLIITISCALIQIYIHLVYFLHLIHISDRKWIITSLIFTIFIVFILVLGSVWIMTHLHHNLMM
ncbi:cytochrome o ubiquinol oxidase, subunit IV [Candidatus Blochmanniella vafra str. BVAF]|uniref:Cytochrome bo(3) ubiquinol oxidase subunit 4 n=1 Tax=Blochmanniella vafra (strain BVAF) TaxID=859654 RepID=E8Q625_BLOVB|nr:cytochrome o ubiquinol oxidase subunit IV [Candidatus Blochmannia vafer]ADV33641.1 cytochrome o ubiquinol oxidase, subunit IV [Candidatus Blochmannia vafer str. BVAF]